MNLAITVGYKADGGAVILADPSVPIDEQKRAFKREQFEDVERVELWTRSGGCQKSKRLRRAQQPASGKVEPAQSAGSEDKAEAGEPEAAAEPELIESGEADSNESADEAGASKSGARKKRKS